MATAPNQRKVVVHREKCERDFLQIKKENWFAANKDLEPYGLQVYLYLAGNRDGFTLELSQEAAEREAGIKKRMFVLQELWRGNITPSERFVRSGSEYKKIAGKLSDEMDRLMEMISPEEFLQIFVREEDLRLSVIFQLSDALHRILTNDIFPLHPIKEHTDVSDVIVDGGNADRFAVVPSAVRAILFLGKIVDIEGVLSTHHQIVNVLADNVLCDFIHSVNLQFIRQPTTEKMEGLFIAAHGFFTQLGATAIKHKFIGKPLKIQIFHTKNTPVHWGKIHPINQEYSLVQRKKFIGMKTRFYTYQSHLHCIGGLNKKTKNLLRPNQKFPTSALLS